MRSLVREHQSLLRPTRTLQINVGDPQTSPLEHVDAGRPGLPIGEVCPSRWKCIKSGRFR